ncbi:adenylate/guanylate cyclase domain-containing protein [Dendronalium sp. ChiSLP03b]|uniref:adenylate/guanylate cyclase domain-containing protein n=1 Tax=Dendronalium sp. ChiSLP03b TaxID=3075381 RepID=UPI002AD2E3E5|nr:adenylate/guanylate cyclase domain-containing protein [Dendronalium sp. ChiSLP03b]MDZ8204435.1 adenylate/guanylate cyclase domain-containing protein [Dendronalium sp. ChiSLP03b]
MTELTLRLQQGDTESTVSVNKDEFTIGRLPECDLYLPFGGVSRQHARLVKTADGVWTIEDLGSKNGTQVNQNLVTSVQKLHQGDIIWLGNVNLVVQFANPSTQVMTKYTEAAAVSEQRTIFRNVKQLQQQWIAADSKDGETSNKDKTIARLKDLVDIAKNLCAAASIEEIFSQVQEVVFRYLDSIDRLALLIDVNGGGHLELVNAGTRNIFEQKYLAADGNWISRSICQKVFEEKVAIQTADTHKDERFAGEHSILVKGIRSAMAVPLWDENKVVGVLYADAHLSSAHWENEGEEELSFFSALANLVASSVQRWLLAEKLKTEEVIRHRLERYHSPSVVQQLIAVGGLPDGRLAPAESEISILFADLVGFTAISERLTPTAIAQLLNNLFEEMLQEVFACGGTLDKYIGDCIMAFFGAPELQIDHADRATTAAKGMLTRLECLNANGFWQEPLQLRIAINSGKAVVGDVGSSQRVDYTALGATINLAARMEAVCPPGECVISEATHTMLSQPSDFREMGDYRFKGIDRSVKVYQTKLHQVSTLIMH